MTSFFDSDFMPRPKEGGFNNNRMFGSDAQKDPVPTKAEDTGRYNGRLFCGVCNKVTAHWDGQCCYSRSHPKKDEAS